MSNSGDSANGQAPLVESFRERVARHIAGTGVESNWSIIVGEGSAVDERRACQDCDGLGFVALSEARLAVFAKRVENIRIEAQAAAGLGKLEAERQLQQKIRDEQWKLNRESVCRTCRGSCYESTEGEALSPSVPHDSMFNTVSCPRCRGSDRRHHPSLMSRWAGSSSGTGCPPLSQGGCGGTGYLVPITVRPAGSGGSIDDYAEELEDVPIYHRPTETYEPTTPEGLLSEAMAEDPRLAAALVAYLGEHGDKWAKEPWGRRFSVWPFVAAGERLVAESAVGIANDVWYLRNLSTIEAERRIQESEPEGQGEPRRRMLIKRADSESRWLARRIEQLIEKHEAA